MMKNKVRVVFIIFLSIFSVLIGNAFAETHTASYTPWSGYWWPFTQGGLANGSGYHRQPSPLSKYDYVTSGTYRGTAQGYGNEHYYDPAALSWEGMCFCWSAAAILEEEPVHKGYYNGTLFRVGDKKGLLTVKYDGTIFNKYPILTPLDFHQLLETFIRDQQTPVIIDLGTNGEIWNFPVYEYETEYSVSGSVRHYTTTIYYASDGVHPDFVGTITMSTTYYYYIKTDPLGEIIDSGWEGSSIIEPPVNGFEPLGTVSRNPGIDNDILREIVEADDDVYEENDTVDDSYTLLNGTYALIAADDDFFDIPLNVGDSLKVELEYQENSDALNFTCYGPSNGIVFSGTNPGTFEFEAVEGGDYRIELIPTAPESEQEYTLWVKQSLEHQGVFPINPGGLWVNGIGVLDNNETQNRILMTLIEKSGLPFQGVNISTDKYYQKGSVENSYGLMTTGSGYIVIDSDLPTMGVHSAGTASGFLMGSNLLSTENARNTLFFPYTPKFGGYDTYLGIINIGDQTETVVREGFDENGNLLLSGEITLDPGEKSESDTSSIGMISSSTKSMRAYAKSGRDVLLGYYKMNNPVLDQKGWAVIPLNESSASELIIPHVASNNDWDTGIYMMNAGLLDSAVEIVGYSAEGNQVAENAIVLNEMQQTTLRISTLFSGINPATVASIRIRSLGDEPLSGIVLFEQKNKSQFTGLPLQSEMRTTWAVPHLAVLGDWNTCLGIVNMGESDSDTTFRIFGGENQLLLQEESRLIAPHERMAFNLKNMFSKELLENAAYLTITSENDQPLIGFFLYATIKDQQLMGGILQ